MEEIKISLDGNYCITGDGETARKVKRLLDDKDGVGCCKDGQIKSSSLTIQIKGEKEYVVRPKNSSKMDLRLQLPNTFEHLRNYLTESLAEPQQSTLFGSLVNCTDEDLVEAPRSGDARRACGGTADTSTLYTLFNQYQLDSSKDIYFNDGTIICASLYRWISQLSSEFLFDDLELFFNTYRIYLSSTQLANILFKRFEWTLEAHDDEPAHDEPALELVRVRTFVMLRSWISNYFGYDFVPNLDLRLLLSNWINQQRDANNDKSSKMIDKLINIAKERQSVYENYKKHSMDESISSFDSSKSSMSGNTADRHLSLDFSPGPPTTLPSSTSSKMTVSTAPTTPPPHASEHDSIADTFVKTFNKVGKIGKIGKRIMSAKPQRTDNNEEQHEEQPRDEYTITISFEEFCQLQELDADSHIPKNIDKNESNHDTQNNNDTHTNNDMLESSDERRKSNDDRLTSNDDLLKNNSIMTKVMQLDDLDYDLSDDDSEIGDVASNGIKEHLDTLTRGKKLPHMNDAHTRLSTHSEATTDSQVELDNWQKTFTIEGLDSDDEEDGDVDAALRALEGHIDKVKQEQKLRKVESMMQRSKKKRMSQGISSNDGSENTSPNLSPIIRTNSVFGASANASGAAGNTVTHKPRSHSVAITTTPSSSSKSLPINRKRGLSHGSTVVNVSKKAGRKSWILDYKTEVLSKQFSLIEKDLFNEIKFEDIEHLDNWQEEYLKFDTIINWISFMKEIARRKVSNNGNARGTTIKVVIARFNMTVRWVASEILCTDLPEDRTALISKFIRLAFKCQQQNNFMTLIAILRGLDHAVVRRMADAWPNVSKQSMRMLTTLRVFCSDADNYAMVREVAMTLLNRNMSGAATAVSDKRSTGITRDRSSSSATHNGPSAHDTFNGCIPFVGLFLSDLLQADKCPEFVSKGEQGERLINVHKLRLIHSTRKSMQAFQENTTHQYDHRVYLDGNLYRKCLKLRVDARVLE